MDRETASAVGCPAGAERGYSFRIIMESSFFFQWGGGAALSCGMAGGRPCFLCI